MSADDVLTNTSTTPVVVLGASVAGLSSALFLARAGHRVIVVDRDADTAAPRLHLVDGPRDVPARRATPQANHSHVFLARLRLLLADRAPDVLATMLACGIREIALRDGAPATLTDPDAPALDDPDLVALAGRRTTLEEALRSVVVDEPGVTMLAGRTATDVVLEPSEVGPPRLTAVVLDGGETIVTDVLVDATGRRTAVPGWLTDHGVEVDLAESDCGISYLSRFYRSRPGSTDPVLTRGFTAGSSFDGWSCLVFPADDGTFSVTFGVLPEDRDLRGLTHPDAFDAAVAAIPSLAAWTDPARAEPISAVAVMSAMKNRLRRYRRDGTPIVTGIVAAGDAAATTNPAHSRGCTLAVVHAVATADAIIAHRGDGAALNAAADEILDRDMAPWVRDSIEQDAVRLSRWRAGSAVVPASDDRLSNGELYGAAQFDPLMWRAFSRMQNLLAFPDVVLGDPATVHDVRAGARPALAPVAAPTRSGLIELISTATAAAEGRDAHLVDQSA